MENSHDPIPPHAGPAAESGALSPLRGILLAILVLAMAGNGADLLLLGHTEDWQLVPVVVIAAGLLVAAWHGLDRRAASLRALQATMIVFVLAGLAGFVFHYQGNMEFELEMYPSMEGLQLIWESMTGATPALAPGSMIQMGLIGLAYCFRHPARP